MANSSSGCWVGYSGKSLSLKYLMLVENRNEVSTQITITQKTWIMKGKQNALGIWGGRDHNYRIYQWFPQYSFLSISLPERSMIFCLVSTILHTIMGSRETDLPSFRELKLISLSQPWESSSLLCFVQEGLCTQLQPIVIVGKHLLTL